MKVKITGNSVENRPYGWYKHLIGTQQNFVWETDKKGLLTGRLLVNGQPIHQHDYELIKDFGKK